MPRSARFALCAVFAGLCLLATAPASFAQAPSLSGESLESDLTFGGLQTTTFGPFTCNKSGTTTIPFQASGSAFGSYVGTFTESGTVTVGPQSNNAIDSRGVGPITAFQSTFTIQSEFPSGTVTGSKSLSPTAPTEATPAGGFGRCNPDGSSPPNDTFVIVTNPNILYTAQINVTIGSRSDNGNASAVLRSLPQPPSTNTFQEIFNSTAPTPPPPGGGCDDNDQGHHHGNHHGNHNHEDCDDQGEHQ
jgi:hypothetical protein